MPIHDTGYPVLPGQTVDGGDAVHLDREELALLAHLAEGRTAELTAKELGISTRTLRRRVRSICTRLEVATPMQAVVWAAKQDLI